MLLAKVDRLLVGGVPLHRDLRRALVGLAGEEDHLAVDGFLVLVEVGDEVLDAALVAEGRGVALSALVDDRDLQAAGEEGGLAQALLQCQEVEVQRLEDVGVGQERDGRAGRRARGQLLTLGQLALRRPACVILRVHVAVAADLHVQLFGQRVDDRHADSVQAAGDLVAAAVAELAAGMQHREHDLDGRQSLFLHDRDGYPTAVVGDGHRAVRVHDHRHFRAVAGERLVDGVVDDLVDEMVQAHHAGRSDVHAGALAHRLEAFQNGDVLRVVGARPVGHGRVVDAALLRFL
jgi:hypothetical protein